MKAAPSSSRIRVLVVEDSRLMRDAITQILSSDPGIEVVGMASDGHAAIEAVTTLSPDVVTMDIEMPRADGLFAVKRIMAERPTPILIISASAGRGAEAAVKALALGAVDCIAKPVDFGLHGLRDEIIRKVRTVARVKPVRTTITRPPAVCDWRPCVVIAASTGGPAALLAVVPELPSGFPASVIIVQHLPDSAHLAKELAARSEITVKEAEDGEALRRGVVYVAPGGRRLTAATDGRIALQTLEPGEIEFPSADSAMTTVAQLAGPLSLGVVMTGMGRDGTAGARAVRAAGGIVIAQDEGSSLVYGMPRAAFEGGGVDAVVPLSGLAPVIRAFVQDLVGWQQRARNAS